MENKQPFDEEAELYNKIVALYFKECKKLNPNASSEELQEMAEEFAAPYFFQNKETERPH